MRTICLVVALVAAAAAEPKVFIRLNPLVLFSGDTLHLTCKVPQDAANRYLEWGVDGYRASRVALDGGQAVITHDWFITHVPCDVDTAFCRLLRTDGSHGTVASQVFSLTCRR